MLFRSDSHYKALARAALKVEQAHATPESAQDFQSLRRPGGFTRCSQMELLHHAGILLRDQGRIEELAKDETYCQREFVWVALYPHLRKAGYILPQYYAPRTGNSAPARSRGPSQGPLDYDCNVFPAICTKTGAQVVLKLTCSRPGAPCADELEILRLLNTEPLRSHPDNAAVRLLDVVPFPPVRGQPRATDLHIIVMPVVQQLDTADCAINGYALNLMMQSFRTVAFLHSLGICHQHIGTRSFMVAPTKGGPYQLQLVDFGLSQRFDLCGDAPSVSWSGGQIPPPEVEEDHDALYDPFEAEIFSLGETWRMLQRGRALPEVTVLLDRMTRREPAQRPSAAECVAALEAALPGVGLMTLCGPTGGLVTALKVTLLYAEARDVRACVRYAVGYVCAVGKYIAHGAWDRLFC